MGWCRFFAQPLDKYQGPVECGANDKTLASIAKKDE